MAHVSTPLRAREPAHVLPMIRPARALVADESDEQRAHMTRMLEPLGFEVAQARDGRALFWRIEELRRMRVEWDWVVFTDVRMPVYGGLEVLEAWREDARPCRLVVTAADPDHALAQRVRALGGLLLAKPFTAEQLHLTLTRACDG